MKTGTSLKNRQGGAVAVVIGISIIVLVSFLGLVLDLGRLFITKTELQNGVDACALAAARDLTGDTNSLVRAEAAGITVGGKNKVDFQTEGETGFVVEFSEHLDSGYTNKSSANPARVKYVKCTLPRSGIAPWFMGVMGIGQQAVSAMAVASLEPAQTTCAIPVGMCKKGDAPTYGFVKGEWLDRGVFDPGAGGTGSYNWIDFNPGAPTEGCGSSQGANELKCLLAEKPLCNLPTVGTQVGQQGYDESLVAAYNTRFGVYKGSYDVSKNPPDYSGFAYQQAPNSPVTWPNASPQNAYLGVPSSGSTPNYNGASGTRVQHLQYQFDPKDLGGGYSKITTAQHGASPPATNRRVVIAPIVDCAQLAASNPQSIPVLAYACVFLLRPVSTAGEISVEFLDLANTEGNPCATSGLAGGTAGPLVPALRQ